MVLEHTDFHVLAVETVTELFDFQLGNGSFLFQIVFVAHYHDVLEREVVVEVVLINPLKQMEEGFRICYIEHQDATMGLPVVRSSHLSEPFLPRSVPDLQLHLLVLVIEGLRLAIHAHCYLVALVSFIQCGTHQQRGLPATRIPNDYHFEHVVVWLLWKHSTTLIGRVFFHFRLLFLLFLV